MHMILMLRTSLSLSVLLIAASSFGQSPQQKPLTDFSKLKDGDLVFIESSTNRAEAIKKLSKSIFSHCGIVFIKDNVRVVYEGAGRGAGKPHSIEEWQKIESTPAGENQKPDNPLHPIYARRLPTLTNVQALKDKATELHHTSYDNAFQFGNKDGEAKEYIYCSELNFLAFNAIGVELGTPRAFKDYYTAFGNKPEKIQKVKEMMEAELNSDRAKARRSPPGKYNENDLVIAPVDVFLSDKLVDVND
jgi:hypothetical protein